MNKLIRDPLLHFTVIGVVLFVGYAWLQRGNEAEMAPTEIWLTLDDLSQMSLQFESQWRRQPTQDELHRMVQDRVREEILYREALALGLDRDDTIVRRRMAQKMQFLTEDTATSREPSADELRAWFDANADLFAYPPRVGFRHLYFSPDVRGDQSFPDAEAALEAIAGQPEDTQLAQSMGDRFMFMDYYVDATPNQLAREFGPDFSLEVLELEPGEWRGPLKSGFGWHLVFVDRREPGRIPPLEEVEQEVKTAWLSEQRDRAWSEAYEKLRARYTVKLPASSEEKAASEAPATGE